MNAAHPSRLNVGEWIQIVLLGGNLIWTTLCLGGYRAETMAVSIGLSGALLVAHFVTGAMERWPVNRIHPASAGMLPFLLYAAANVVLVSPVPWLGWRDWLGWANLALPFWVVLNGVRSRTGRRALFLVLIGLGLTGAVIACYQRFVQPDWLMLGRLQVPQFLGRASGPFGIPNSFGGLLILLLPAVAALVLRPDATAVQRVWWGWVTAVLGVGLFLTLSRGAWIALGLALMAWPLVQAGWNWKRRIATASLVLGALVAGVLIVFQTAPTARARLERLAQDAGELSRPILWRAGGQLFLGQPVTGTGAGSYNVLFERHRPEGFVDEPQWAHNDYLNTLSDYGLIGFVLLFGVGGVAVVRSRSRGGRGGDRSSDGGMFSLAVRRAMGVGLLAFSLQLFVEFHFKIPALGMTCAVLGALALGEPAKRVAPISVADGSERLRRGGWLFAALGVAVAVVPATAFFLAESWRNRGRDAAYQLVDRPSPAGVGMLQQAEADLVAATRLWGRNGSAWADLAFVREFQAYLEPARAAALGPAAEGAARRALQLSDQVAEFWVRLGVALDLQGRQPEARQAFERSLELAPASGSGWYYYAFHLARDTGRKDAALRAIAKCLSLDPGNRAAEALRLRLNTRL